MCTHVALTCTPLPTQLYTCTRPSPLHLLRPHVYRVHAALVCITSHTLTSSLHGNVCTQAHPPPPARNVCTQHVPAPQILGPLQWAHTSHVYPTEHTEDSCHTLTAPPMPVHPFTPHVHTPACTCHPKTCHMQPHVHTCTHTCTLVPHVHLPPQHENTCYSHVCTFPRAHTNPCERPRTLLHMYVQASPYNV